MQLEQFVKLLKDQSLADGVENILNEPIEVAEIAAWQEEHPDFELPKTYQQLLRIANGLTINASEDSPNGLMRFFALDEVRSLAEQVMEMSGLTEEDLTDPPTCLMIGEDSDCQWCLGLDTAKGHFLEVDYAGETQDLGKLPEFLDWVVNRLE